MTRIASKLLLSAAIFGGICVAVSGGLNAGANELPVAPTSENTAAVVPATDADGNVVDLRNWQQTRVTVGKTCNNVPTLPPPPKK